MLRESVTAEGMLIVRDNEEARALEMATGHKPLLTSMLHGLVRSSTKEQLVVLAYRLPTLCSSKNSKLLDTLSVLHIYLLFSVPSFSCCAF